ncbi:MAG: cytoplasmic protein [Deltaproteobacteria bacterium]|nr:cytoplasmic protein [Deltaproteobacteria bacterium]
MSDTGLKRIQVVIDPNTLYLEEIYTDLKVGRIRKLTPVRIDGELDKSRKSIFVGETQLGVKGQIIPIQCEIDAKGLADAVEKYPAAIEATFEQIVKEAEAAKKAQKENESRIIVPK